MMTPDLPTPEHIRSYLSDHGWHEERRLPPAGVMFSLAAQTESGHPLTVFVPEQEGAADYPLRVADVVTTLAAFEDRSEDEVRADMLGTPLPQPAPTPPSHPADPTSPAETSVRKGA